MIGCLPENVDKFTILSKLQRALVRLLVLPHEYQSSHSDMLLVSNQAEGVDLSKLLLVFSKYLLHFQQYQH